jgi:hypothetical protein
LDKFTASPFPNFRTQGSPFPSLRHRESDKFLRRDGLPLKAVGLPLIYGLRTHTAVFGLQKWENHPLDSITLLTSNIANY